MNQTYEFNRVLLALWTAAIVAFVLAPLVFVVAVSLTPLSHISLPSGGVSLRWYAQLLERPEFAEAAWNSIVLGLGASASAVVLGVLAALAIVRYRIPYRETIRMALTSPLFVPMVLSGLAILVFFAPYKWATPGIRLYVAHSALTLPYVMRTVSASLSGFDMNQELAARNLGASPAKAFFLVTLPQLGPGVLAGTVFAFIVSFDNVGLSIFLTGAQYRTLPVELFAYMANENDPMAAALSVVMIAMSLIVIVLLERMVGLQRLIKG